MRTMYGILVLALCVFLIGTSAPAQEYLTFSDPGGRITLQYPAGWETGSQEYNGQTYLFFLSPLDSPQDQFQENVTVSIIPLETGQETLEMVESFYVDISRSEIPDLERIDTQDLTVADLPARLSLYTGSLQGFNLAFLILYIIYQNDAYILQGTAEIDSYQHYQSYFLDILGSFTPTTAQPQPPPLQLPQPEQPELPAPPEPVPPPDQALPQLPDLD